MTAPPARFVILEHRVPGDPRRALHWDLMLEQDQSLLTWALLEQPRCTAGRVAAERLPNHRLAYLDYEGPVSGQRGWVRRWDRGTYDPLIEAAASSAVSIRLHGTRLQCEARIVGQGTACHVYFCPDSRCSIRTDSTEDSGSASSGGSAVTE